MNHLIDRQHPLPPPLIKSLQWALDNDKGLIKLGASFDDLTAIYPYYDYTTGQEVFVKARFDKDGKKWIKPFCFDGQNYRMSEPPAYKNGKPKPLYLPAPLSDVVYIVEGEKCVNFMIDIGLSATTTGGATSVDKCDLTPLHGRKCVLWRDNDESGSKWQGELITALERLKIAFEVIDIAGVVLPNGEPLAEKGDCADFIESHLADGNDFAGVKSLIEKLPRLDLAPPKNGKRMDGNATNATCNAKSNATTANNAICNAKNAQNRAGNTKSNAKNATCNTNNAVSNAKNATCNANTTKNQDDPKAILQQRKAQLQTAISELASLDPMELDLSLRAVASEFGIPQKKILEYVVNYQQGELIPSTTPANAPITGQELYQELYGLIDDFMIIDEPYKVVFVLWVIFTYLLDSAEFAPLVWITSPEKQCGKSTLLGLFARVADKAITANSITPSALQRVVEKYRPCLLIDEIDANLDKNSPIWGVINGGHSKTADKAIKCNSDNGNALEAFSAYGAKVICGIGANLPAPTISRTIRFVLRRKTKDDKPTKRFVLKNLPYTQTDTLKSKIKRWAMDNGAKVAGVNIPILDINDRDFDNWEFLLQIASVLGVYDVAVNACFELCRQEREPTQNELLLADIREVWDGKKMSSKLLLDRLNALDESVWQTYNNGQPMTAHQLAKKLKSFGIKSKNMRQGQSVIKGFDRADFDKVWGRYLSPQEQAENPFLLPKIE